jgi:hypothetical protein
MLKAVEQAMQMAEECTPGQHVLLHAAAVVLLLVDAAVNALCCKSNRTEPHDCSITSLCPAKVMLSMFKKAAHGFSFNLVQHVMTAHACMAQPMSGYEH